MNNTLLNLFSVFVSTNHFDFALGVAAIITVCAALSSSKGRLGLAKSPLNK
jgi:hypothetical protein